MARYTGATCRLCRREGMKLFLKGDRCFTDKCAFVRRSYAPGQHGANKKKLSGYGVQLREKQKAKRIYGVLESQFRAYYEKAEHMKGISGENLLKLLEMRLDNVVYRLGYGASRNEARQLVTHGHFLVNGKKVDICSYPKTLPAWLEANVDNFEGKVVAVPSREEIDVPVNETLIVELYSK